MRLVCPKCAAQYEVDVAAIPQNGRDVQCASCGNTWFQAPVGPETFVEPEPQPEPAPETPTTRPATSTADRAVLDILRREAEYDAAARQGAPLPETEALHEPTSDDAPQEPDIRGIFEETEVEYASASGEYADDAGSGEVEEAVEYSDQLEEPTPDLAAQARAVRDQAQTERPERPERPHRRINLAEPEAEIEREAEMMAAPRRPRKAVDLPDVESLKSSLRAAMDEERGETSDSNDESDGSKAKRKRRAGFYLALNVALILMAIYVLGDQLKAALPESTTAVDTYVEYVDTARRLLADGFSIIVDQISGLISGEGTSE